MSGPAVGDQSTPPPWSPTSSLRQACSPKTARPPSSAGSPPGSATCPSRCAASSAPWFDIMRHGSATPPPTASRRQLHRHPVPLRRARLEALGQDTRLAARDQPGGRARRAPASRAAARAHAEGLRSVFKILKGRKLAFTNPVGWIREPSPDKPVPASVDLAGLRRALDSPNPATALLSALLAFHAVRIYQACRIWLADIRDAGSTSATRSSRSPPGRPAGRRLTGLPRPHVAPVRQPLPTPASPQRGHAAAGHPAVGPPLAPIAGQHIR